MRAMGRIHRYLALSLCLSLALVLAPGCSPYENETDESLRFQVMTAGDLSLFEKTLEGLGRMEKVIRLLKGPVSETENREEAQDPAAVQLAEDFQVAGCTGNVTEINEKLLPSAVKLTLIGLQCPARAHYGFIPRADLKSHDIEIEFEFPKGQALNSVDQFSASGFYIRQLENETPIHSDIRNRRLKGHGKTRDDQDIEIEIDEKESRITGKTVTYARQLRLQLRIGPKRFELEARRNVTGTEVFLLNGETILPKTFEDYFSKLGLIGKASLSTDAG